jgi:DNA-binding NarL/FixJ family response regulator
MMACLAGEQFKIIGESSVLRPLPRLAGVDILVFESVGSSLRQAVRLTDKTQTRLVATISDPREADVCRLIEAGVSAVLPHADLTCENLISSMHAVLSGISTKPSDVLPRLLQHARRAGLAASGGLNDREREVLKWLADGSDTSEIALGLSFSERTVKNVVHDILMKLNCRTRAHAVALATRSGVI